jgi:hypothetical protein
VNTQTKAKGGLASIMVIRNLAILGNFADMSQMSLGVAIHDYLTERDFHLILLKHSGYSWSDLENKKYSPLK